MLKKILLGTLFVGLIGVLAAGAAIRTMDRTELVAEARGNGEGQGQGQGGEGNGTGQGYGRGDSESSGEGRGRSGAGEGSAGGNGTGAGERQYPNYTEAPEEWLAVEGVVVQAPAEGQDLVIQTADGDEITVGTGPMVMAEQGFALQAGEQVQVRGYWDDGEFKAAQLTRQSDGQTITLRDEVGRPAWAGAGRNAQGGQGQEDAPGDGAGTGQANVEEWLTLQGTVVSVDADALVVETAGGEQVTVENRPWWFAQEQGFSTEVGNQVSVTGFYENGDFEAGEIVDLTADQSVLIRDESGRPLWAGRGRRGV